MTDPNSQRTNVHLLDAADHLSSSLAHQVREVAEATARTVANDLGILHVDVVVCDYRGLAIQELGVGGYSPGDALAVIAIEPWTQEFESNWEKALPATIAHELHHVRRWQGPGYGNRLVDSLVCEGFASLYECEATGSVPLYCNVADRDDLQVWWEKSLPLLNSVDQHARFFFGMSDVPRWAGYAVGFELARRYCALNGTTAKDAVDVPADQVALAWEQFV